MPELSRQIAITCATNENWSTQIKGSKGDFYTVSWVYLPGGGVQYDYQCTCPGFVFRGRRITHCKHIETVIKAHLRCGWNESLEPTLEALDGKCPNCGGPVTYIKVGV